MSYSDKKGYFADACKYIVGGVNSPVRAFNGVDAKPVFVKKGVGAYIIDEENNSYVDFVQSWGPLILGHCDSDVTEAVSSAVKNGLSFGAPTIVETMLAKEVLSLFSFLDKIRFVSSGTEAVMSAIRLARGYTKRDKIVKFAGCYHGHSDALLVSAGSGVAEGGTASSSGVVESYVKNTLVAEYNNLDDIEEIFRVNGSEIACVIVEPIAGNMGFVPADKEFLLKLRELCSNSGALLIFDEVMSGFRASLRGSYDIYNIEADIVTFGKVIGGGMPVGAFAGSDEIMNHLAPLGDVYQAGTLSGNPVAMSAGLATLRKVQMNRNLYSDAQKRSEYMLGEMKSIAKKEGISMQVNSIGTMFGYFFNDHEVKNFADAQKSDIERFKRFFVGMLNEGIYFASSQYETAFISTVTGSKEIDLTINAFKKVVKSL